MNAGRTASQADVVAELRALGLLALDRLEPLVARLAAGEWEGEHSCTSCPLCAAATGLRGERAEVRDHRGLLRAGGRPPARRRAAG